MKSKTFTSSKWNTILPALFLTSSLFGLTSCGSGSVASSSDLTYTIEGTISGLTGTGLSLLNNGGDSLVISTNGPFNFAIALARDSAYNIEVATQPSGQTCSVSNGSGTVGSSNITDVIVLCTDSTDSTMSITSLDPASGSAGDKVTIAGSGFDEDKSHLLVSFPENVSAEIISASKTEIVVTVPAGAVTGIITVTDGLNGNVALSSAEFTITGNTGGTDWTRRTYGSVSMLKSVAYGSGIFAAVGFNTTIVTSNDGIAWTRQTPPDTLFNTLYSIVWDGAQFVAVGDVSLSAPSNTPPILATSGDGRTWTRRDWTNAGSETALVDVTAGGGQPTAVGVKGTILSSTDGGLNWSHQTTPSLSAAPIAAFTGVASNGATRVAVGRDAFSKGFIIVSADGVNWVESRSGMTTFYPQDVLWSSGNQFIAVGASNANAGAYPVVMTSPDGVTWTKKSLPESIANSAYRLNDVAWDGVNFIAVGDDGADTSSRLIITSLDGTLWSVEKQWSTPNQGNALEGVAATPTKAVVVGDSLWTKP